MEKWIKITSYILIQMLQKATDVTEISIASEKEDKRIDFNPQSVKQKCQFTKLFPRAVSNTFITLNLDKNIIFQCFKS